MITTSLAFSYLLRCNQTFISSSSDYIIIINTCNIISKPVLPVNTLLIYIIYTLLLPYAILPGIYLQLPPPQLFNNDKELTKCGDICPHSEYQYFPFKIKFVKC